jgi:hypothetical protein
MHNVITHAVHVSAIATLGLCTDQNFSAIFTHFRREKLAFFLKINAMIHFLQN